MRAFVVLVFLLLLTQNETRAVSIAAQPSKMTPRTVIFQDDFESSTVQSWWRPSIDGNGSVSLVNMPKLSGQQAVRFSVPDDGQSYRSELSNYQVPWGSYRYRFAVYVPAHRPQPDIATIVAQWHGYKLVNGQNTNPPISLDIIGNHWRFIVYHLTSPTTVAKNIFILPDIQTDTWNQFELRIRWSTPQQPGVLMLYRNQKLCVYYKGVNNYHQQFAPYFKIGIYRPEWNSIYKRAYPVDGPPLVIYEDDVSVSPYSGPW